MAEQESITPRESEALAVYDSLPESERSYANVAQALGVTEGRAGVYVRDAMRKSGRSDTPRRGRKSGTPTVSPFTAQLEQLIAANEATLERLNAQIGEAEEAASTFNAEQWIAAESERLDQAAKEARARATAFSKNENGEATQAAEEQGKRLRSNADAVREANEANAEQAREAVRQAQAMLATLTEQPA